MSPRLPKYWPLAAAALLCIVPAAHAQRVSAKDRAASGALKTAKGRAKKAAAPVEDIFGEDAGGF